jgi:hypothetical protein
LTEVLYDASHDIYRLTLVFSSGHKAPVDGSYVDWPMSKINLDSQANIACVSIGANLTSISENFRLVSFKMVDRSGDDLIHICGGDKIHKRKDYKLTEKESIVSASITTNGEYRPIGIQLLVLDINSY